MNLLCPDCHFSVSVDETEPWLRCDSCGLKANLSRIETAPGSASFPMVKDRTGETLGGYQLQELVGVGGMGVVYKARREGEGDDKVPVAVKVLNCDYHWQREEFVSRFQREAKALARLDHPNIVSLLDSGQVGDQYYLVTEYVDGVNLAQYLRSREPSLTEVVELLTQVCAAITYAHEHGVVHRDIKPANVVIAGDQAKVLDFGLAQITGGSTGLSSLTRTDLAMGTINYLSPEQRTNAKHVDERSDVFSLGVVLYEMLTGRLPLGGFEPASHFRPELGRRGDRVVARTLEASPQRRTQTVAELAGELRQLVQPRHTGRLVAVAAVALVALGLGAGVWRFAPAAGGGRTADPVMSAQVLEPGLDQGGTSGDGGATDAAREPASIKPGSPVSDRAERPVTPLADNLADSANGLLLETKGGKKSVRTRGVPTLLVDSRGRKYPWLGGKGLYRIGKGAWPVAIVDHKGQQWDWPKGATLTDFFRIWYADGKVKGGKGVGGGNRVKRRQAKRLWRPPKGGKKGFLDGGNGERSGKRKRAIRARPKRQPLREPARRRSPPTKFGK